MGLDEDASCWGGGGVIWNPLYPLKKGKVKICAVYGISNINHHCYMHSLLIFIFH